MAEPGPAVADGLARWLRERGDAATVEITGQATVGLSQETWFARVAVGEQAPADVVLRLPTAASGARAIVTQRKALQAVAGSRVPAPELLWFDDEADGPLGRPFLVMTRVAGTVPVGWSDLPEPERLALAEQAIDALVELHALDATSLGPPVAPGDDLARLARRLERVGPVPDVLRAALAWLEARVPPAGDVAIVHGDFRMGNLAVDDGPDHGRPRLGARRGGRPARRPRLVLHPRLGHAGRRRGAARRALPAGERPRGRPRADAVAPRPRLRAPRVLRALGDACVRRRALRRPAPRGAAPAAARRARPPGGHAHGRAGR